MIKDLLGKKLLFFDGAMGTLLQEYGLPTGGLPEVFNKTHPEIVQKIHKEYLDAGCNIITTNTFGANKLKLSGTGYSVGEIAGAAVQNARMAAKNYDNAFVAFDMGPTGKLLAPCGDLEFSQAYELYREMVLASRGADCILIETISDTYEAKAAILAAKENSDLPVFITITLDENGRLLTGGTIDCAVALFESLGVDALGFNCGFGPEQLLKYIKTLETNLPIITSPNAGLPTCVNGKTEFSLSPAEFAKCMKNILKYGVSVMGGCCGTTPEHLKALIDLCKGEKIRRQKKLTRTLCSSYSKTVEIGECPIIVGERLNPTGKKRLKQALIKKDFDYILSEAINQADNGAHVLDINVGLNEIDEPSAMEQVVCQVQSITDLPLQIDTSNIEAMERGLRCYNGKCIVNSVNGKAETMEAVFPLIKKYGGLVVALLLDETGIPHTSEGRFSIAKKIIRCAKKYGIQKTDILFDPLAMTISTGADNAKTTLKTLKLLHEAGLHSTLGVSNISFGLPKREIINSAFYSLALSLGLSAGIINPGSAQMKNAYDSHLALYGFDKNFVNYIDKYSQAELAPPTSKATVTLGEAVQKGLREAAEQSTKELLNTMAPLDIINAELIPSLDKVGELFEQNKIFLPQLLMSADAAKSAFSVIKDFIQRSGAEENKKGKILLATVKGDIHDIGKNIVRVLLENYGYDVVDLGKNVDIERIVKTVSEQNIQLVGLSALMTTTVGNMELTIKELRHSCNCKIMVGGAVLTKEYAKIIGADFYSKDAMQSVRYAEQIFK